MSLYNALYTGVSALKAESSAIGVISDNVANMNTLNYKRVNVDFSVLVSQQSSTTTYSSGGLTSTFRRNIDEVGSLQNTGEARDIVINGSGFFTVSSTSDPISREGFAFTRSGRFRTDHMGYLRNQNNMYLQGWSLIPWDGSPTASTVDIDGKAYMKAYTDKSGQTVYINDNIIDTNNLQAINPSRISGTSVQTSQVSIGANLNANAAIGETFRNNVSVYDTLGNDSAMIYQFIKRESNNWDIELTPPRGAAFTSLRDNNDHVYQASGRLDFTKVPRVGSKLEVTLNGQRYVLRFGDTNSLAPIRNGFDGNGDGVAGWDANADGSVTSEDYKQIYYDAIDTDKDGKLSALELENARIDRNFDGVLDIKDTDFWKTWIPGEGLASEGVAGAQYLPSSFSGAGRTVGRGGNVAQKGFSGFDGGMFLDDAGLTSSPTTSNVGKVGDGQIKVGGLTGSLIGRLYADDTDGDGLLEENSNDGGITTGARQAEINGADIMKYGIDGNGQAIGNLDTFKLPVGFTLPGNLVFRGTQTSHADGTQSIADALQARDRGSGTPLTFFQAKTIITAYLKAMGNNGFDADYLKMAAILAGGATPPPANKAGVIGDTITSFDGGFVVGQGESFTIRTDYTAFAAAGLYIAGETDSTVAASPITVTLPPTLPDGTTAPLPTDEFFHMRAGAGQLFDTKVIQPGSKVLVADQAGDYHEVWVNQVAPDGSWVDFFNRSGATGSSTPFDDSLGTGGTPPFKTATASPDTKITGDPNDFRRLQTGDEYIIDGKLYEVLQKGSDSSWVEFGPAYNIDTTTTPPTMGDPVYSSLFLQMGGGAAGGPNNGGAVQTLQVSPFLAKGTTVSDSDYFDFGFDTLADIYPDIMPDIVYDPSLLNDAGDVDTDVHMVTVDVEHTKDIGLILKNAADALNNCLKEQYGEPPSPPGTWVESLRGGDASLIIRQNGWNQSIDPDRNSNNIGDILEQEDPNPDDGIDQYTTPLGTEIYVDITDLLDDDGHHATIQGLGTRGVDPENLDHRFFTIPPLDLHPDHTLGIEFSKDGTPQRFFGWSQDEQPEAAANVEIHWTNGSSPMNDSADGVKKISLNLGNYFHANGITQYASGESLLNFTEQDGNRFGRFQALEVRENGVVYARFDNQVLRPVFMIPVATAPNNSGMQAISNNLFNQTTDSGDINLRTAGEGGAGKVASGAIEGSTVDIGEEFSEMIMKQRAYSGAAKIISTADEMLQELINIKR